MRRPRPAGCDLALIDADGTPNKARLGANAILGVSLATAKAAADELGLPLFRYVGGAGRPCAAGPDDERRQRGRPRRQLDRPAGVHDHAGGGGVLLRGAPMGGRDLPRPGPGAEGSGVPPRWATRAASPPTSPSNEEAVQILVEAIEAAGRTPGKDIAIAADPASSEFYRDGPLCLAGEGRTLDSSEMVEYWVDLVDRYPIVSIEDAMAEDDWEGWAALTAASGIGSNWSATTSS